MYPPTRLSGLVLVGLCALSMAAEPKRDRNGDPLPDGAVARLGSLRLRTEQPIVGAAFASDGKTLAAYGSNSLSFWVSRYRQTGAAPPIQSAAAASYTPTAKRWCKATPINPTSLSLWTPPTAWNNAR